MKPIVRARRSASSSGVRPEVSRPSMKILPSVGVSMQPMRLSSVDLPLPEGPAIARKTPSSMLEVHAVEGRDHLVPEPVLLRDVFDADQGHRRETGRGAVAILICGFGIVRLQGYSLLTPRAKMSARLRLVRWIALACALVLPRPRTAEERLALPTDDALAASIVQKADQIRFPAEGFEVGVTINTTTPSGPADVRKYRVLSKGNENTVVMTTEPASERGQIMLMKGRDLWIFLPAVSQPVRLPLAQRLTGAVANGDLARANFAGDYKPRLLRTETIDGEPMHVLELTAVDRSVTYHRVLYWVRQSNNWPHKAEFYSLSERLLKTCLYQKYERMAGRERPTRLTMQDALRAGEESVLDYTDMKLRDLPDKIFTKDYLKRLE